MNGLDSPIEINLVPLLSSTINNLWTLVAILTATAAFSLWRLRGPLSLSSPLLNPPTKTHMQHAPQTTSLAEEEEKEKEKDIILTRENRSNSSKELYTVFYDNEDVEVEENEDEDVDGGDEEVVSAWRDDDDDQEDSTVEMRGAGDLGWYGYQDRRVINGSVVRLWEERSKNTSPRSYRRAKRSLTF